MRENDFSDLVDEAFSVLGRLHHTSSAASLMAKKILAPTRESQGEDGENPLLRELYGLGTNFPVPDYLKSENAITYHSWETHVTEKSNYIRLMEEMICRYHAQIVCTGFEETERHLVAVAAKCYALSSNGGPVDKSLLPFRKEKFNNKYRKWSQEKFSGDVGTTAYYEKCADFQYGNRVSHLINDLEKCLEFSGNQAAYAQGLAYGHRHITAIAFCRHQTAHVFGRCTEDSLKKLEKNAQEIVRRMSSVSIVTGELTILPSGDEAAWCVERLAGLILHVHRGLSDAYGMEPCL